VDVGVVVLIITRDRVDHRGGLLRGLALSEMDHGRPAVDRLPPKSGSPGDFSTTSPSTAPRVLPVAMLSRLCSRRSIGRRASSSRASRSRSGDLDPLDHLAGEGVRSAVARRGSADAAGAQVDARRG